jgi:ketopantoate reductase
MRAARVAIVGAGALGRVYGVRLALRARSEVTLVVREERAGEEGPLRITRVDGDRAEDVWERPVVSTTLPDRTDAVVVTVRADQLDDALSRLLEKSGGAPIVVFTPMLPADYARLRDRHGERVLGAMAGVAAYRDAQGACRYWLPQLAPTLVDEPRPPSAAVTAWVNALERAGFVARLQPGVPETNAATAVTFVPLAMGIDAAGGVDALLADRPLFDLALAAVREGIDLSLQIGSAAPWVASLTKFAGPMRLRMGAMIGKKRYPEAFAYVEDRFGRKLHAQNVAMGRGIAFLAGTRGAPHAAILALLDRLEQGP